MAYRGEARQLTARGLDELFSVQTGWRSQAHLLHRAARDLAIAPDQTQRSSNDERPLKLLKAVGEKAAHCCPFASVCRQNHPIR